MLAAALPAHAEPVEVGGVKYEPSITVANTRLQLNGAGVRYKAIFKVYTAGLYLNGKAASEPIREPEFFAGLLKIWLGKSPADSQLKDALLGKVADSGDPHKF